MTKSILFMILKVAAITAVIFSLIEFILYKNGLLQETIPFALILLLPVVVIITEKINHVSYGSRWKRSFVAALFFGVCMIPWKSTLYYGLDPNLTEMTNKKEAASVKKTKRTGPEIVKPKHTHIGRELEAEQISKNLEEDLNAVFTPFTNAVVFPLGRAILVGSLLSILAALISFNKLSTDD